MGTTYRYGFKPKGHGYTKWVTKQKPSKSRNTHKGNGILGDAVADVAARAIVGAVAAPKRKYKLCRDPAEAFQRRRDADEALNRELDLPNNNNHRFGGNKMDESQNLPKIGSIFPGYHLQSGSSQGDRSHLHSALQYTPDFVQGPAH